MENLWNKYESYLWISILFILVICPGYSQTRTDPPHCIFTYISKIDSLSGEVRSEYYPEMKVSFEASFGAYDTTDNLKGKIPILPFSLIIEGKRVSYPEKAFLDISRKNKDTCYNKQRLFPWRYEPEIPVVNDTILAFHVICDGDYDTTHPQGTYLDDIVVVEYERHVFNPIKQYKKNKTYNMFLLTDYNQNQEHTFIFPRVNWGLIKPPQKEDTFTFTFIVIDEKKQIHKIKYQPVKLKKEIGTVHTYY